MKKIFLILALCALAACGNPLEKVEIVEVRLPAVSRDMSALSGELTVENMSARRLTVESARLGVRYKGREMAAARLVRPVAVPARTTSGVKYEFAIENVSKANMQALQIAVLTSPSQLTVDIEAEVSAGGVRKKVRLEDVPLMKIITNFGGPKFIR